MYIYIFIIDIFDINNKIIIFNFILMIFYINKYNNYIICLVFIYINL